MKHYKRLLTALMVFMLMISFSGCIVIPQSKYYDIPAETVASIQFYRYDPYTSDSQDFESYHLVHTVPAGSKASFLTDFSNVEFTDTIVLTIAAVDPSFSYGDWVVRINLNDGQYTLYSSAGFGQTFDADGNCTSSTHFSCDAEVLDKLIQKYYKHTPATQI